MQESSPLLHTKLRLPFTRSTLVSRHRLQKQITQGLRGLLTLITAPAGFGKTTLVTSCIPGSGWPVAWLSLDKDDNQAGRFLNYLVAALQEIDHKIGREASQLVASQQAAPEAILTSLINDLDTKGKDIILVLDDYHFISSQAVHEQVSFLLEHCPNTLHLVMTSRSDPALSLARLRSRGQMVELRAKDLSFSEAEAAQFLNDVMGLCLDARSISILRERTEGWAAGLQMAALSMRDRKDVTGFIEKFSGTNRYILDYLLEEVLASQPPEIQRFLLHTSVLERLTAPLCDSLWKAEAEEASSFILDYLDRANIFLVPLDEERTWYRYHHLFADLLRTRLSQVYPGLTPQLHLRAAAWLEHEGMMVEAINHTLSAGEYDRAARMVEQNTTRLLAQGELNALMDWIEMLPVELRSARPWLCIHQAYALLFAGRTAEVWPLLSQAEVALGMPSAHAAALLDSQADKTGMRSMDTAEVQALNGSVAVIRAFANAIMIQDAEALSLAQQARELLAPGDLFNQSLVAWSLGYILHSQGRLPEARSAFEEQIRLCRAMQNNATLMIGLTALARVLGDEGKLGKARALLEEALFEARQKSAPNLGFIARTEAHLAGVLYEQNELESAHRLLSDALNHARFWLNLNHLAFIYSYLTSVLLAEGDLQGVRKIIGEADHIRRRNELSPWLQISLEAEIVRVWLSLQSAGIVFLPSDPLAEQSNLILASWQNKPVIRAESQAARMDQRAVMALLILARRSLAAQQIEDALALLGRITRDARAAGHTSNLIQSLVLTAVAWQSQPVDKNVPALAALEEALVLGEPGGYMRVFLNEGKPIQMLLAHWLARVGDSPLRAYALRLLSQFNAEPHRILATRGNVPPAGTLAEPLSPRELEVLHLMALGRTNQEIAEQLVVAAGTVKAHAASIYRKLEASNRTEAVSRARQLGLLL